MSLVLRELSALDFKPQNEKRRALRQLARQNDQRGRFQDVEEF